MFEKISCEASKLAAYNKRSTITSRDIQLAVRLTLPVELGKHAELEGAKALENFRINTEKEIVLKGNHNNCLI